MPGEKKAISVKLNQGLDVINTCLSRGKTIAFAGSSRGGKLSIINAIPGMECRKVVEISENVGKGKHATTQRNTVPGR